MENGAVRSSEIQNNHTQWSSALNDETRFTATTSTAPVPHAATIAITVIAYTAP